MLKKKLISFAPHSSHENWNTLSSTLLVSKGQNSNKSKATIKWKSQRNFKERKRKKKQNSLALEQRALYDFNRKTTHFSNSWIFGYSVARVCNIDFPFQIKKKRKKEKNKFRKCLPTLKNALLFFFYWFSDSWPTHNLLCIYLTQLPKTCSRVARFDPNFFLTKLTTKKKKTLCTHKHL